MKALKTEESFHDELYPESDGRPMADSTMQYRWIVKIKEGLEILYADDPDVFVAADLLWYPREGERRVSAAPDVMVVLGRPRGDRGSYRQWEEGGVAPQVVFEILSPGNRPGEMGDKLGFYERHGVEEYYVYDPRKNLFEARVRLGERLRLIETDDSEWTSPRLKIRFDTRGEELAMFRPDGERFLTPLEERKRAEQEKKQERSRAERAEREKAREKERAERAEQEKARAELEKRHLAEKLRELGIDPEKI